MPPALLSADTLTQNICDLFVLIFIEGYRKTPNFSLSFIERIKTNLSVLRLEEKQIKEKWAITYHFSQNKKC